MNAATRTHLKQLLDARKRAQIAEARGHTFACSGCGADRDARTVGCDPCSNRYYSRSRKILSPSSPTVESPQQRSHPCKSTVT